MMNGLKSTLSLFKQSHRRWRSACAITLVALTVHIPMPAVAAAGTSDAPQRSVTSSSVAELTQQVGTVEVFYRAAGPEDAPVLLLLHGYPSSSHMFRELIPLLATQYRVIAPDFPGFGKTIAPDRSVYEYTFDSISATLEGFTEELELNRYAMYVFDYGAPVGFRLATSHPERVSAIISQNGNVYEEGLTDGWEPIRQYWNEPTQENREALKQFQTLDAITWQYTHGVPEDRLDRIGLEGPAEDVLNFSKPEGSEIQLDLFGDYKTNVNLYPEWQAYLAEHQPPVLAVWAENDPFFGPAGAEAFQRDVPDTEVHMLNTGHFALETHAQEISNLMHEFLARKLP